MAKYAGADWLKSRSKERYNVEELSPMGEKVADVLGQVEKGIYHIEKEVAGKKNFPLFLQGDNIRLSFDNGCHHLSSFDNSRLTALFLCASAAGVEVKILGTHWSRYAIEFCPAESDLKPYLSGEKSYCPQVFKHVVSMCNWYCDKRSRDPVWDETRGRWHYAFGRYPGELPHDVLYDLLRNAHDSCIRIALYGLSPKSLEIRFYQRDREGTLSTRHPTWEEAIELHRDLWEPLLKDAIA